MEQKKKAESLKKRVGKDQKISNKQHCIRD